jgi:hypothetical protein
MALRVSTLHNPGGQLAGGGSWPVRPRRCPVPRHRLPVPGHAARSAPAHKLVTSDFFATCPCLYHHQRTHLTPLSPHRAAQSRRFRVLPRLRADSRPAPTPAPVSTVAMEPLFLDGPAPVGPGASLATPAAANVHPVVLFSILEQHLRREEGQDRVIGSCTRLQALTTFTGAHLAVFVTAASFVAKAPRALARRRRQLQQRRRASASIAVAAGCQGAMHDRRHSHDAAGSCRRRIACKSRCAARSLSCSHPHSLPLCPSLSVWLRFARLSCRRAAGQRVGRLRRRGHQLLRRVPQEARGRGASLRPACGPASRVETRQAQPLPIAQPAHVSVPTRASPTLPHSSARSRPQVLVRRSAVNDLLALHKQANDKEAVVGWCVRS